MASYDSSDPRQETVTYTGTWERSGRSLTAAAVAGLLGVGVIYSNGQSILATIALFAHGGFHDTLKDGTNLFQWLEQQAEMAKTPIRLSLICSQFLLMLLPTLWIIRHWHTANVRAYLRLHGAPVQTIAAAVAATALFFPTNVYLTELFVSKLGIPQELIIINQKVFTASSPGELVFLFVAIGLTPAICEEVLFRGYAQRTLERTMGWKSVFLVGIVFGLYHMQPLSLFSLSGLGILLGYYYYGSRSLLPGMAAHFTNNVIAVAVLYSPHAATRLNMQAPPLPFVLLTLSLAIAALIGFQISVRKVHPPVIMAEERPPAPPDA